MSSVEWPEYTRVFGKVSLAELEYIQSRRQSLGIPADEVAGEAARITIELDLLKAEKKDPDSFTIPESEPRPLIRPGPLAGLVGLALSGGGIRSATFNLGLLQALARQNILRYCDYLSTVSGGGYIGSRLSSLLDDSNNSVERDKFPFRFGGQKVPDERKEIKWLREHSNYLAIDTSFFGWDIWRMIGTYLSGLVLTNLMPFAVVLLALYLIPRMPGFIPWIPSDPLDGAKWLGGVAALLFYVMVIARWGFAMRDLEMPARRWRENVQAALAGVGSALAALAGFLLLLKIWPQIQTEVDQFLQRASLASVLGVIVGAFNSQNRKVQQWLGIILRLALAAMLMVLFFAALRWLANTNQFDATVSLFGLVLPVPMVIVAALLLISATVNTNRITLHHFYRDRLSEAYVIKRDPTSDLVVSNESLTMDVTGLRPDPLTKSTPLHHAVGRIKYPGGLDGILIYIKSSVTGTEPEDLLTYGRQYKDFPNETTSDQFFDEPQFESYRKLGDLIGDAVFSRDEVVRSIGEDTGTAFVRKLFEIVHDQYERWCASANGKSVDAGAANSAAGGTPGSTPLSVAPMQDHP